MKNNIDRREFLKTAGSAALAVGGAGLMTGCGRTSGSAAGQGNTAAEGGMTYRTSNKTGNKISILGYGCMRWPMIKDENGRDIIDQETVNRLVDYAMEHGVNYYDSSPVYLQGQSERATGNALKRYPRDSYYIATKLSNMNGDMSQKTVLAMYYKSFQELQTDYIDYYLLHNVSDYNAFKRRFEDNGVIDYLLEERKAGNTEFKEAEKSTLKRIKKMNVPEADVFLNEFIPAYEQTLDNL